MKHRLLYPVLGTMVLAACSDDARNESELPSTPGVIVAAPPVQQPSGCSFKDAQSFAKNYFLVNSDRQAASTALSAAATYPVGNTLRNDELWKVLALVAKVGGNSGTTSDAGPAATGANLVSEVVDCGPLVVTDANDESSTLTSALSAGFGEFAIPTGALPVIAENCQVAIGPTTGNTWEGAAPRIAAFIGQLTTEQFVLPTIGNAHRIGLISDNSLPALNDDYFTVQFDIDGLSLVERVGRSRGNGQFQTVLQAQDVSFSGFPCPEPSPSSFASRLLDRVTGFFLPTPLQALVAAPPPWSGSTGGLESDFAVVTVEGVTITVPTIPNGVVGQPVSFTISAHASSVPIENVVFTISVAGNQGSPVELTGSGCSGTMCTLDTNEQGAATFSVIFEKAGGYTLSVSVNYSGFDISPILTNLFQITGS